MKTVAQLDTIINDENKLKRFLINDINDVDRPLFYRRCVELRTGFPIERVAYTDACQGLFGPSPPAQLYPVVPDFGSPVEFRHSDELKPLPPAYQAQQLLLCLIASNHHKLTHCPYIVDLIPLLARYYNDAEGAATMYGIVNTMLTPWHHSHGAHSYYFTLSSQAYIVVLKKFYLLLKMSHESVKHHLKHLGIDSVSLFETWIEKLWVGYHSQSSVVRMLDGLMAHGLPWLWTWAIALIDSNKKSLLKCNDRAAVSELVFGSMAHTNPDDLIALAYDWLPKVIKGNEKLKQRDIDKYSLGSVPHARETAYHVPRFPTKPKPQTSEILSEDDIRAVWCWLDNSMRVNDPTLLYATSVHGYSLKTLVERATTPDAHTPHGPTVTVVKANNGAVFGIYLSQSWVKEGDAAQLRAASYHSMAYMSEGDAKREAERMKHRLPTADGRCFVFTIQPGRHCYRQPQARAERLKHKKEYADREAERRTLTAGRDGLRHTGSGQSYSSAARHADSSDSEGTVTKSDSYEAKSPRLPTATTATITSDDINKDKDTDATNDTNTRGDRSATNGNDSENGSGNKTNGPVLNRYASISSTDRSALAAALQAMMDQQRDDDSNDPNTVHMMCSNDFIAIGDSSGVAFSLDSQLRKGVSQPTLVFQNPNLAMSDAADGSFECVAVEIWGLVPPHL